LSSTSFPPWKSSGSSALASQGRSSFGEFPCTFPVDQGGAPRDEFAPDSPHRHRVCVSGDSSSTDRRRPRNSRDSAGFWLLGSDQSEPERAGLGLRGRRCARLSLLASWAVRIDSPYSRNAHARDRDRFSLDVYSAGLPSIEPRSKGLALSLRSISLSHRFQNGIGHALPVHRASPYASLEAGIGVRWETHRVLAHDGGGPILREGRDSQEGKK